MHREILHLYGPFAINSFGLMIVVGLILFSYLLLKDSKRPSIISTQDYFNLLTPAIFAAIIGARLLFAITHFNTFKQWMDLFAIWHGGFSLLGAIIALIIVMPLYFKQHHIPLLPFLDLIGIYAPLLQSISRIGCYLAGCCYGCPASSFFVTHPAQLYSAFSLFIIFIIQYCIIRHLSLKKGQLFCIYLMLMSIERFYNDFFRADREMSGIWALSIAQLLCIIIFVGAVGAYLFFHTKFKKNKS